MVYIAKTDSYILLLPEAKTRVPEYPISAAKFSAYLEFCRQSESVTYKYLPILMNADYIHLIRKRNLDINLNFIIIIFFVLLLIHNVINFTAAISVSTNISS
jgi:hypothetical protein